MWMLLLIVVLSGLSNWAVYRMLFPVAHFYAPAVIADAPYFPQDWRGLV